MKDCSSLDIKFGLKCTYVCSVFDLILIDLLFNFIHFCFTQLVINVNLSVNLTSVWCTHLISLRIAGMQPGNGGRFNEKLITEQKMGT